MESSIRLRLSSFPAPAGKLEREISWKVSFLEGK